MDKIKDNIGNRFVIYCNTIIHFLVKLIVLLIPLSFYMAIYDKSGGKFLSMRIAISDLLTFVALFLIVLKIIVSKERSSFIFPGRTIFMFIIAIALSITKAASISQYVKELAQLLLSFYFFYIVLLNGQSSRQDSWRLINLLIISAGCTIPVALYQYYIAGQLPYYVRSTFPNRNIYSLFLAVVLPLTISSFFQSQHIIKKAGWLLFTATGLLSILAVGHLFAACSGILITAFLMGKKTGIKTLVSLVFFMTIWLFLAPNRIHSEFREFISIYEQKDIGQRVRQIWGYNTASSSGACFQMYLNENKLIFSTDLMLPKTVTNQPTSIDKQLPNQNKKLIKQYYAEWVAAIRLLLKNPLTGCGVGNYQENIGSYYNDLQKNNTSEPNFINGYLVMAASSGFLGLLTLVYMLFDAGNRLNKTIHYSSNLKITLMFKGLAGSFMAIIIGNLFTPIFTAQLITLTTLIICILYQIPRKKELCD